MKRYIFIMAVVLVVLLFRQFIFAEEPLGPQPTGIVVMTFDALLLPWCLQKDGKQISISEFKKEVKKLDIHHPARIEIKKYSIIRAIQALPLFGLGLLIYSLVYVEKHPEELTVPTAAYVGNTLFTVGICLNPILERIARKHMLRACEFYNESLIGKKVKSFSVEPLYK